MVWAFLAAAIALEVGGALSLRASDGFTRWEWAVSVVIGYAASFVLLAIVLKRGFPVGVAAPLRCWRGFCSGIRSPG